MVLVLLHEGLQDGLQECRQEGRQEGLQEGRQEEAANLVLRQLIKQFGELSQGMRSQVLGLSLSVLEELSEALLDFTGMEDLQFWLDGQE